MPGFIVNNLATLITLVLLAGVITAVVISLFRDKKRGKHLSCSGDCKSCGACIYAKKDAPKQK